MIRMPQRPGDRCLPPIPTAYCANRPPSGRHFHEKKHDRFWQGAARLCNGDQTTTAFSVHIGSLGDPRITR